LGNGDRVEQEPPVEKVSILSGDSELDKHDDHKALDKKGRAEGNTFELERDDEATSSHHNEVWALSA
jgi:hypothetical protein